MFCRRSLILLILSAPLFAVAADAPPPSPELEAPPQMETIDEPDAATEPQVTIIKRGTDTIEEYRIANELYMMKVTPAHGKSYYLVKESAAGGWVRQNGPGEPLSVPQWILFRF
ncbi:MAG: DUF2782 domain-containing protein [Methylobacillus sp.]|jgi:hypothetical protein|nr:DUF2782 domain-containing protein [Methylobacillus sp.]